MRLVTPARRARDIRRRRSAGKPKDNYGILTATSVIRTPHDAGLNVPADLRITARLRMDDWTSVSAASAIVARRDSASTFSQEYMFNVPATGGAAALRLDWTTDGDVDRAVTSTDTLAIPFPALADGDWMWVRATLDVDNGAAGHDAIFEASDDDTNDPDSVTWTPVGTTVTTAGTTSIIDRTNHLEVGSYGNGSSDVLGGMQYAAVEHSGTEVARLDLRAYKGGGTYVDPYGHEFTLTDVEAGSGTAA